MEARHLIRREYGASRNFVTPTLVGYVSISPNVAVELSTGDMRPLVDEPVFGVSVVGLRKDGRTHRGYKSAGLFHTREAAEERIKRIQAIVGAFGA